MVSPEFDTRFSTLRDACLTPPRGPGRALRSLPPEGTLPPPWSTWAPSGLLDRWRPKAWAWARLEAHLTPARPRRPGRPPLEGLKASGVLSGLTAWTFELDGVGGLITDRTTGECLRLQLDAGPGVFRRSERSEHLRARCDHGPAGRRRLEHPPRYDALPPTPDAPAEAGLFDVFAEDGVEPGGVLDGDVGPIGVTRDAWDGGVARARLAALAGDPPAAPWTSTARDEPAVSARRGKRAN